MLEPPLDASGLSEGYADERTAEARRRACP